MLVGFAAETENVEYYAKKKLVNKNADMIVANNVSVQGAGFASDTNAVTMFKKDGTSVEVPMMSKQEVAKRIITESASMLMKD